MEKDYRKRMELVLDRYSVMQDREAILDDLEEIVDDARWDGWEDGHDPKTFWND